METITITPICPMSLSSRPLAISTWFYHNNHMLWLAMSMFMVIRMMILGVYLVKSKELKIEPILDIL